jgi:hypothetical protein
MADAAGKPGEVQPPKNQGGRPDIDFDFLARRMERLLTEMLKCWAWARKWGAYTPS